MHTRFELLWLSYDSIARAVLSYCLLHKYNYGCTIYINIYRRQEHRQHDDTGDCKIQYLLCRHIVEIKK